MLMKNNPSTKFRTGNVLVTGGAGFIGSHLVDELIKLGYGVAVVDDLSTGKIENINSKAKFIKFDLGSKLAGEKLQPILKNIDHVFHLAAIPRIQYCLEHSNTCHSANVNGALNLLNSCVKNKHIKKFIHISSCMVYGASDVLTVSEDNPLKPKTIYGVQKHMQELYLDLFTRYFNIPSVVLRYFGVYGTKRHSESGSYPNVTAAFSRYKRTKNKLCIYGDGKQSRDFVHVFDIIKATILAMKSKFVDAEVFNIGTGMPVTINEIAQYYECLIEYKKARPDDVRYCTANIKKAKKLLKWQPRISFDEGIKGYLNQ